MNTLARTAPLKILATPAVAHLKRLWTGRFVGASLALMVTGVQAQPLVEPAEQPATPTPVNSQLDAQLFYQLLLGELNIQDGDVGTGFALMLDAAQKKHDAQLYRRAVDIAL